MDQTEDNFLSQSSELDEDSLNDMDAKAQPENTLKNNKWAMARFEAWLRKRQINLDLVNVSGEELAPILRRFYGEVKSTGGKVLTPSSLVGIRAGIQRVLMQRRDVPLDIIHGEVFAKANNTFTAKCKLYAQKGNPKPKRKEDIAEGDLSKIHGYLGSDATTQEPRRLQQAVWFALAFNLGCRGREIYRQLKKDSLLFATDDQGRDFFTIEQSVVEKNHNGGPSRDQQWSNTTRVYDCDLGAHRLLDLMRLYLSKLHPDCEWLFQQCKMRVSISDEIWYKKEPLGVNSLGKMMQMISAAAGLSQSYTNHCVRATTITLLFNAGVTAQHIQARTGHRTTEGLQPYIGQQTAQQRRLEAQILGSALRGTNTDPQTRPDQSQRNQTDSESGATAGHHTLQAQTGGMSTGGTVQGHFANCTFTIHVHHHNH